ncbi:Mitochondrial sodium/calcium exchanger protein [Anthophora quadrimaculata]
MKELKQLRVKIIDCSENIALTGSSKVKQQKDDRGDSFDDCSYIWNVPVQDRCRWVKETKDCFTDSIIQYTEILFCNFKSESSVLFSIGLLIMVIWLLYLFLILGTTADNFFCPSLAVIASVLRLSDSIAGVTILAFGNGAPDIFTSIVSGSEEGIIMFTELIGAGVFVTAIIAGSVAMVKPFRVPLKPLMRDACFYIVSVCWISYVVRDETVYLWEAFSTLHPLVPRIPCQSLIVAFISLSCYKRWLEGRIQCSPNFYGGDTPSWWLLGESWNFGKLQGVSCNFECNMVKSTCLRDGRIPSASDPDILRTYLANKDTAVIPRIPVRTRAFGLKTKLDVAIATELERDRKRTIMSPTEELEEEEDDDDEKETYDRPKGLFKEFLYDINPIDKRDWLEANRIFKFILIIRAPVMFLLQLFIPLVNTTAAKRGWSKLLNCFQLCVTPTMALFLLNAWRAHFGPVSVVPIFLLVGTVIGVIVFLMTHVDRVPKFHNVFAFLGFLAAMLTVYLVAGEVMAVLQCVGYAFSISDAMLGITFLAWGNSIGDLISNVAIARRGFPRMGYAACFGGPMFNTLLGLGLTYGIAATKQPENRTDMRMSDMAPGCLAFLLCSLITTIIYLNITGAIARKSYGYLLCSIYFTFIFLQFLSEYKVIHPLGTDHRP